MQDDSGIYSASPKKSKVQRTQSSVLSDSFRMAASVLGSNSSSKKAYTLTIPSKHLLKKKLPLKIKRITKSSLNVRSVSHFSANSGSITAESVRMLFAPLVLTQP